MKEKTQKISSYAAKIILELKKTTPAFSRERRFLNKMYRYYRANASCSRDDIIWLREIAERYEK